MNPLKELPVSISDFGKLINNNFLYVDKTETIHQLITVPRDCFLSRHRRFGKSLLVSTLKEIFQGNKALFKDYWIGKHSQYQWIQRPVIHLDFSTLNTSSVEHLENHLNATLNTIATINGLDASPYPFPQEKIGYLITALGAQTKIVILVDEYDAPILDHITDRKTALAMRNFLSRFYRTIKGLGHYIYFTFITGVTKFSKTSLFSGFKSLNDISLKEEYASLCGYTETEIITNFSAHIAQCAHTNNTTADVLLESMRSWYNGYQMSERPTARIYNPFSVVLCLDHKKLKNYWFESETPSFLIKFISNDNYRDFATIDHAEASSASLGNFDIALKDSTGKYKQLPIAMLMLQTGYLTIERYIPEKNRYVLTFPNQEVRESLHMLLLSTLFHLSDIAIDDASIDLLEALRKKDFEAFCSTLQSLFSHLPYQIHLQNESFYHAILHIICVLSQIKVDSEVSVARGSADMLQNKPLYLIGLNIDYATKTLTYEIERI